MPVVADHDLLGARLPEEIVRGVEHVFQALTECVYAISRHHGLHSMLHFELARAHQSTRQQEQSTSQQLDTEPRSEAPRQIAPEAARTYSRGAVVSLAPAADGTRLPDSTILAVPGDRIHVSSGGLFINGEPVTTLSSEFIAGLPEEPWDETIKAGHYFLAAEHRTDSGVVRFWGLIPSDRIAATR